MALISSPSGGGGPKCRKGRALDPLDSRLESRNWLRRLLLRRFVAPPSLGEEKREATPPLSETPPSPTRATTRGSPVSPRRRRRAERVLS